MKRAIISKASVCAAVVFCASLAVAQTDTKATKGKAPEGKLVKASEVVGAKLFNQQGQHVGEINDVVFDENTGKITHGMLAVGGWLGVGENIVAVPWKHVRQSKETPGEYVVDVGKSKLTREMTFKVNDWPKLTEGWFKETYSRFGLPLKPGAKLVRASTAIGAELFGQTGRDIGEIENLLMHPGSGKIAYATCEVDEYAAGDNKLTNVPWNLIRQSKKDTEGFIVNADAAKLKGAKYFSQKAWPDYNDPLWHDHTYGYYGVEPFWSDRAY